MSNNLQELSSNWLRYFITSNIVREVSSMLVNIFFSLSVPSIKESIAIFATNPVDFAVEITFQNEMF